MSACHPRVTARTAAPPAAIQAQLRAAAVRAWPLTRPGADRGGRLVLRSPPQLRWVEAIRRGGGGEKIRRCSLCDVGGEREVGDLVGKVVGGDRTAEVLVAAGVTMVLGVGNRVLYKLALVPLRHYPFFLAQLATFGYPILLFLLSCYCPGKIQQIMIFTQIF